MTITPMLSVERQKIGDMGILQVIDYSVIVWICNVYSDITKASTSHDFFNDSHFSRKETS